MLTLSRTALLFTATVLFAATANLAAAESALPNILILYADDLGYGDLSGQNPEGKIKTPNLDALARSGMRFTDGHSSSGICSPSRYALLTGRHHWRDFHGIVNAFGKSVFAPARLTLPEMLKSRGYATACIGKWHLGWDWEAIRRKPGVRPDCFDWSRPVPDGPLAHGFDRYFGDDVINFPPYAWIENDRLPQAPDAMLDTTRWKRIKEGNWECREGPMLAGWDPYQVLPTLARKGVEFLEGRRGQQEPFFLYFAFPSPHAPIIPNDEFDGRSGAGAYGDFVVQTDHVVGQLLAALERAGQAEKTIVVFTADNGPEQYAYARDAQFGHWSAAPFRGLKRDIYEGGHHVPFLLRWPGVTTAGSEGRALVSQIDLMATFAAAIGFELPNDAAEDSHNMLPYLRGETNRIRATHVHNTAPMRYAIRHEDWLLIQAKDGYGSQRNAAWERRHKYPADDDGPVELYHLATDPGQRHNVADKNPKVVEELSALLKKIREQGHSAPRLATTNP